MMTYSLKTGIRKTIKNVVVVAWPFVLAVQGLLPPEWAALIGALSYFVKNWAENR